MLQTAARPHCWICGDQALVRVKPSGLGQHRLSSSDFAITDRRYGLTAAIDRCSACGFLQCSDIADELKFYSDLDDTEYDAGRAQRALQARALLRKLDNPGARSLLDVGAGSGILVEEALRLGYRAEGVEPSAHLAAEATAHGVAVHRGALPHPALEGRAFDIVTLVDVIEHVSDPITLLRHMRAALAPDGIGIVVTPDVESVAARLLGWRWWHYRIAHIGYFNRSTLELALRKAGLRAIMFGRPRWYFSGDYLGERLVSYLPGPLSRVTFKWARRITVPLDLRDSMFVLFQPAENCPEM